MMAVEDTVSFPHRESIRGSLLVYEIFWVLHKN